MSSKQRKRMKKQALKAADGLSGAEAASQPEANGAVRKSVGEGERSGRYDGVDGKVPSGEGESAAPAPVEEAGGGKAITPARQLYQTKSSKGKAKKKKHEKDEARKAALKREKNEAQERMGGRGVHASGAAADVVVMIVNDDSNGAEPTDVVSTNGKDTDVMDTDAGNGDPKVNAEDNARAHAEGQTAPDANAGEKTNTWPSEEEDAALLVVRKPASKEVKSMAADRLSKWAMNFMKQRVPGNREKRHRRPGLPALAQATSQKTNVFGIRRRRNGNKTAHESASS